MMSMLLDLMESGIKVDNFINIMDIYTYIFS